LPYDADYAPRLSAVVIESHASKEAFDNPTRTFFRQLLVQTQAQEVKTKIERR